ncbi:MAG: DUF2157 domain-containing protein [Pseudomonadota bacterium]
MSFNKQLQQRLPHWIEQGWVSADNAAYILADVQSAERHGPRYLALAFSVLGVVLLGSGVITFFAANWAAMPKLLKLGVLFSALWGSHVLAGVFERRQLPLLATAMLLLGVILFGSNIMLIAQIYHISAHYPDGVLVWALGGMLTGWLMRSQPALVAGIGLGVLWTGLESQGFDRAVHWPFLPFLAAAVVPVLRQRWRIALHVALVGLLAWSWFTFLAMSGWGYRDSAALYLVQVYFLAYLALFLVGMLLQQHDDWQVLAHVMQRYAAFAALACLYLLTFPDVLRQGRHDDAVWWMLTVVALLVVTVLAAWHYRTTTGSARPPFLNWGLGVLFAVVVLLLVNLAAERHMAAVLALLFNLVYFAGLLWLLQAALHLENRALVNMAFFFFAITLLARYFDTFWSLMDRSLFFMGGGLLLLGGGYWLERQRRRLTRQIAASQEGEA